MTYRTEMMNRIVAMQHEALDAAVVALFPEKTGIDAVPYWPYEQEGFPYLINRYSGWSKDLSPEDIDLRNHTVRMSLVYSHLQEGIPGERQEEMYALVPLLEDFFITEWGLTTSVGGLFPNRPDWLFPIGTSLHPSGGLIHMANGGVGTIQIGEDITISMFTQFSIG